ncbi:uncharacterized protein LOC111869898 isoform X6 [Cryptotermes secundus]|uniref:uncharacterized protein LOC111869898 isoform X6 n=1 Tax=Cryptotermes secundus TaxID=105785 RepID=UPI000CD7BC11|nr:uncharacterized protein LOC111869898 isoform X6 [Cryptotermes secundus]
MKICKKPRIWTDSLDKRPKQKKMGMRFCTYNNRGIKSDEAHAENTAASININAYPKILLTRKNAIGVTNEHHNRVTSTTIRSGAVTISTPTSKAY